MSKLTLNYYPKPVPTGIAAFLGIFFALWLSIAGIDTPINQNVFARISAALMNRFDLAGLNLALALMCSLIGFATKYWKRFPWISAVTYKISVGVWQTLYDFMATYVSYLMAFSAIYALTTQVGYGDINTSHNMVYVSFSMVCFTYMIFSLYEILKNPLGETLKYLAPAGLLLFTIPMLLNFAHPGIKEVQILMGLLMQSLLITTFVPIYFSTNNKTQCTD